MTTFVSYTRNDEDFTAELIKKQGLFFQVQDADGNLFKIPAKIVTNTFEESDSEPAEPVLAADLMETPEPAADDAPGLAEQALAGPVLEEVSDTISLSELCDTYGVVPRIARRQLRSAVAKGNLAHDARTGWNFPRADLDDIMKIITSRVRG